MNDEGSSKELKLLVYVISGIAVVSVVSFLYLIYRDCRSSNLMQMKAMTPAGYPVYQPEYPVQQISQPIVQPDYSEYPAPPNVINNEVPLPLANEIHEIQSSNQIINEQILKILENQQNMINSIDGHLAKILETNQNQMELMSQSEKPKSSYRSLSKTEKDKVDKGIKSTFNMA